MDAGEEVAGELVVARGDGAELLELAEEVLDQVARLVELFVVGARCHAIALGWDHRALAGGGKRLDHPGIGIERLVGDQRVSRQLRQKGVGAEQVVRLAGSEQEAKRIAERIDQRMDLRAQPAFAAADRLVLAGFFCAPALC